MKPFLMTTTAVCLGSTLMANAQVIEATKRLETVTVTTQKQEQSLIEVPINISVADQELIDRLNADDIEEYADFVSGLQVQAQSLNAPSYSLRGVVSDGGRPRVAIFQNGVAVGNPGYGTNLALFDLERIEVVKGPQATLFGEGALVGGINFIQNRASLDETGGSLRGELSDYNGVRVEGNYNLPVSDTLALRFAGQVKNRDGYVENVSNSPDLMGQDTTALRAALHYAPNDRLTADIFINYQDDSSTGTQFKSGLIPPDGGDLSPYTATAMNINEDQVRDELGSDRELLSISANLVYELSDTLTLTSLSAFRDLEQQEAFDSDGTAFNILQFYNDEAANVFSQELRLNYDNGGRWSGFVGVNYFDLDSEDELLFSADEAFVQAVLAPGLVGAFGLTEAEAVQALTLGGVPGAENLTNITDPLQFSAASALLAFDPMDPFAALPQVPLNPAHLEGQVSTNDRQSFDIFADATYQLTDRVEVTGGLRYTKEELQSSVEGRLIRGNPALGGSLNGVDLTSTLLGPDDQGVPRTADEETDGDLTWRLNLAYRISDDINTWIAYGRGRRPEALSVSNNEFVLVDAETLDNIEIGMFGRFLDDRAQVTTSAYYGEYKDFQTSRFDADEGTFIVENSGNATQYGLEFEGQFLATDNVTLYGTYAYTFSEYDDTDSDGNPLEFAGNKFRLSPENSFSLAADIRVPVQELGEVSIVPTYVWKDEHFFEDDNGIGDFYLDGTPVEEFQDAYGLFDMKVTFTHASERWGAYVYGENIFDEEYLIDVGNTGGTFGLATNIRGVPQIFGVGAFLNF